MVQTWKNSDTGRIAGLLSRYPHAWASCGGWAIDLFLGRQTRHHKDVDVLIWRRDQLAIQDYLAARGWAMEKAQDGHLLPWQPGEFLELPVHCIWCRNRSASPGFLEILLNEASDTEFLFRRNQAIRRNLPLALFRNKEGLPYLAPEIVLLYKSRAPKHESNAPDFHSALPALSPARRDWLRDALKLISPEHPWLACLLTGA